VGDLEEEGFVGDGTNQLEADGEAVGGEVAGDRDGGKASEISRAVVAEEKSASRVI